MNPPYTQRDAVRNLQHYLRLLARYNPNIITVPEDGIFDTQTEESVRDFQREYGLPITGRTDQQTWEAIYKAYLETIEATDRTPRVHLFPKTPENYEAQLGEESAFVAILQLLLGELTVIYDQFLPPPTTGKFDETTEEAVRAFQAASGLPVTGRVDLRTWNRMTREFENYAR